MTVKCVNTAIQEQKRVKIPPAKRNSDNMTICQDTLQVLRPRPKASELEMTNTWIVAFVYKSELPVLYI
jgi:hypothetical protein